MTEHNNSSNLPMFYCSRAGCNEVVYKLDPTVNGFCNKHLSTPESLLKKGRGGRVRRTGSPKSGTSTAVVEVVGGGGGGVENMEKHQQQSRTRKIVAERSHKHQHIQRLTNTNTNTQEEFDEFGNLRRRETQQVQQTHEAEDLRTVSERLVAEEKQEVAQHLKQLYQTRQATAQQYPLMVTEEFQKVFEHCQTVVQKYLDTFLRTSSYLTVMEADTVQDILKHPSMSYMEEHDTDGPLHCLILYLLFSAGQNRNLYEKLPLLFHIFHLNDDRIVMAQWHVPVGKGTFVKFGSKVPLVLLERYGSVRSDFKAALNEYVAVHIADHQRQIDISTERAKGFAMQITGSVSGNLNHHSTYEMPSYHSDDEFLESVFRRTG